MSIATELNRIIGAKSDMKTSIEAKGVTVPSNATIDAYHNYVDQITTGGGTPLVESTDLSDYSGATFGDATQYIKGVTIPAAVRSFSSTTPFVGAENVEHIVVESGNTVYDSRNNCNAVMQTSNNKLIAGCKNTVIPNNTVTIGQYAFNNCTGLSGSLTIPNSVTSIEQYAFNGCTGLNGSLTLSNTLTSIGHYAFSNCTGLSGSLTIPDTVTAIGNQSFRYCSGLTSLNLGSGVTTIGSCAFQHCSGLSGTLTIPNSINSIGDHCFNRMPNITKIILPNKYINFSSTPFAGVGVTSVGIVGSGADVEISSQQTSLPENFFGDCASLISVEVPEGVTTMGTGTFHTGGVQTAILPSTLVSTGWGVFTRSTQLRTLTCKAVTPPSIGSSWLETRSLQAIYVPAASVEAYKTANRWSAWASYYKAIPVVTTFNITDTTNPTQIMYSSALSMVDSVEIDGVDMGTVADTYTFSTTGTHTLKYTLNGSANDGLFYNCSNLDTAEMPSGTDPGYGAFANSGLTSITLAPNTTSISEGSLSGCVNLTSVDIPASVTSIHNNAFINSTSLASVTVRATTPPTLGTNVFDNNASGRKIYVPAASVSAYQAAWTDYASDIEAIA